MWNECFIASTDAEGLEGPCLSGAQEREVHPGSVCSEIYLRLPFPAFVSCTCKNKWDKTDAYLWKYKPSAAGGMLGLLKKKKRKEKTLIFLRKFDIFFSFFFFFFFNFILFWQPFNKIINQKVLQELKENQLTWPPASGLKNGLLACSVGMIGSLADQSESYTIADTFLWPCKPSHTNSFANVKISAKFQENVRECRIYVLG